MLFEEARMTEAAEPIDRTNKPSGHDASAQDPRQDAGQDETIAKRLKRDPESKEARLDNALDESMDASDPPASTQPVHNHEPPASSGYDPEKEKARR
jgi:hypothetical protein